MSEYLSDNDSEYLLESIERRREAISYEGGSKENEPPRLYYLDWLRSTGVFVVVLVHCLLNSYDGLRLNP